MQLKFFITLLVLCCSACSNTERNKKSDLADPETAPESTFDQTKWKVKEGLDYPYRDQMLDDLVYNDTVRTLHKDELLALLGEPDRTNEGHLYYMITQKRLGLWNLHTKTLVIKLSADNSIEWMKIHE